jgi:hypothetical protein
MEDEVLAHASRFVEYSRLLKALATLRRGFEHGPIR